MQMSTALLLVDLQNDFFGNGFMNLPSEELIVNISRAVKCARENGWLIIWVHSIYGEKGEKGEKELLDIDDSRTTHTHKDCCVRGSDGAKFFKPFEKLQDIDKDIFSVKHYYSSFKDSLLKNVLSERNITKLYY